MINDGRSALNAWAVEERERLGGPPTPEEVVAFLRGELNAEDAERVESLLVYYPGLTSLLDERTRVVPLKRSIRSHVLSIAAMLVIGLLSVLLVQSRMQLADASRPFVHEARHELEAAPVARGPVAAPRRELPAGQRRYLISVKLTERPNAESCRVDLVDVSAPRKRIVWSVDGVHPNERTFDLTIPGKELPPGSYTIDVYELREGRAQLLEQFPFDVKQE